MSSTDAKILWLVSIAKRIDSNDIQISSNRKRITFMNQYQCVAGLDISSSYQQDGQVAVVYTTC